MGTLRMFSVVLMPPRGRSFLFPGRNEGINKGISVYKNRITGIGKQRNIWVSLSIP